MVAWESLSASLLPSFNVNDCSLLRSRSSMKATYPRLADVVGFITPEQGVDVAKAVMTTQRDNGNRAKYVFFYRVCAFSLITP